MKILSAPKTKSTKPKKQYEYVGKCPICFVRVQFTKEEATGSILDEPNAKGKQKTLLTVACPTVLFLDFNGGETHCPGTVVQYRRVPIKPETAPVAPEMAEAGWKNYGAEGHPVTDEIV